MSSTLFLTRPFPPLSLPIHHHPCPFGEEEEAPSGRFAFSLLPLIISHLSVAYRLQTPRKSQTRVSPTETERERDGRERQRERERERDGRERETNYFIRHHIMRSSHWPSVLIATFQNSFMPLSLSLSPLHALHFPFSWIACGSYRSRREKFPIFLGEGRRVENAY